MKKTISLIIGLLFISLALAYSPPPIPSPVVFGFNYKGDPMSGFIVELTLEGVTIQRETNSIGKLMVDVGSGSPDFSNANAIDLRYSKLILNCGTAICNKEYELYSLQTPYEEIFDLETEPVETVTCPDGTIVVKGTNCPAPPREPVCPECPPPAECPPQPECPICDECPEAPLGLGDGERIIWIIGFVLAGAAGIYFTRNKTIGLRGGLKTYKSRDGTVKVLHKHPGIRGYHTPSTAHRDRKERHPRGQLFPHYERDVNGDWVYKG